MAVTYGCGAAAARSHASDGAPDSQEDDGADGGGDQIAPEIGHDVQVQLLEQEAADDGADQTDCEIVRQPATAAEDLRRQPAGDQPNDDPDDDAHGRLRVQAAFGGMRWFGVELEILNSSSFMSTPISPNNGVER